jgi:hypothetical protein
MAFDFLGSRQEVLGEHYEDLLKEKLSIVKNPLVREKLFEVLYDNMDKIDWEWVEEELEKWYEANKTKTLEELVKELKGVLAIEGGRRRRRRSSKRSSKKRTSGGKRRTNCKRKRRSSRRRL